MILISGAGAVLAISLALPAVSRSDRGFGHRPESPLGSVTNGLSFCLQAPPTASCPSCPQTRRAAAHSAAWVSTSSPEDLREAGGSGRAGAVGCVGGKLALACHLPSCGLSSPSYWRRAELCCWKGRARWGGTHVTTSPLCPGPGLCREPVVPCPQPPAS